MDFVLCILFLYEYIKVLQDLREQFNEFNGNINVQSAVGSNPDIFSYPFWSSSHCAGEGQNKVKKNV